MTDYDEYSLNTKEKITFYSLWFSGAMILGNLFYESTVAGFLLTLPGFLAKKLYEEYLVESRKRELSYQFRDLLYSLSASVAAGHQMAQALMEAENSMALIYDENALILKELRHISFSIREVRESDEVLLRDLGMRSGLEDIRDFSQVYSICRRTGSGLEEAINKASEVLMDKIDVKREIHTITAQKKMEVRILILLPLMLIVILKLISPGYLDVMYHSIQGRVIMTVALLGMVFAIIISSKLTKVEL
ncbi:MAG: type II secretion system F family protein [Anaerovoracaceae bacterium]|jgi:tight adherence protein B